jgi:beta-glucosidase
VVTASVTVRNTGDRPADELVQVYSLGAPGTDSPVRLLLGYRRVRLEPGETALVAVPFDVARLALWHGAAPSDGAPGLLDGDLRVPAATYTVAAGSSSTDLPVRGELTVTGPTG